MPNPTLDEFVAIAFKALTDSPLLKPTFTADPAVKMALQRSNISGMVETGGGFEQFAKMLSEMVRVMKERTMLRATENKLLLLGWRFSVEKHEPNAVEVILHGFFRGPAAG